MYCTGSYICLLLNVRVTTTLLRRVVPLRPGSLCSINFVANKNYLLTHQQPLVANISNSHNLCFWGIKGPQCLGLETEFVGWFLRVFGACNVCMCVHGEILLCSLGTSITQFLCYSLKHQSKADRR